MPRASAPRPAELWDRLPGEPADAYELFLEWASLDPPLDLGDHWRANVARRPAASRPDLHGMGELYRGWGWRERYAAYRDRLVAAKARRLSRVLAREEAAADALDFAAGSMAVAVEKLSTWRSAPGTVPDALVLGLVREHRQRQRDSGEIVSKAPEVVPATAGPAVDLAGASEADLAELERLEAAHAAVLARVRKA